MSINALNQSDISRRGRLIPRMAGFANFTIRSTHKFKPLPVARLTRALSRLTRSTTYTQICSEGLFR